MSFPRFVAVLFPLFMWARVVGHAPRAPVARAGGLRPERRRAGRLRRPVRHLALGGVMARAVLLDALGTMVELERPWPHLRAPSWRRAGVRGRRGARARGDARRDRATTAPITTRAATREGLARPAARLRARGRRAALGAPAAGLAPRGGRGRDARRRALPRLPRGPGGAGGAAARWAARSSPSRTGTSRCTTCSSALGLARHLAGGRDLGGGRAPPSPTRRSSPGRWSWPGVGPRRRCTRATASRPTCVGARAAGIAAVLVDRRGGDGLRSAGAGAAAPGGRSRGRVADGLAALVR